MAQKTWETVGFSKPDDGLGGRRFLGAFHIDYRPGDKEQRKNAIARAAQTVLATPEPIMVDHNSRQIFKHLEGTSLQHVATYTTEPYSPPKHEAEADLFDMEPAA